MLGLGIFTFFPHCYVPFSIGSLENRDGFHFLDTPGRGGIPYWAKFNTIVRRKLSNKKYLVCGIKIAQVSHLYTPQPPIFISLNGISR